MLQADPLYVVMQSAQPDSQVETHLVDLLDFDKFALIKMLVQNRLKVVWCMRLNRAQSDEEHTRIQVHMLCITWCHTGHLCLSLLHTMFAETMAAGCVVCTPGQ